MQQASTKSEHSFQEILQELGGLITGHWLTDLANTTALLNSRLRDINWIGFYLVEPQGAADVLWLGPFQGLPACTMIPFQKGVCGTAAHLKKTMRVEDVDQFPGHIVCDSRSRSEVVVPLLVENKVIGVLDVDSASLNRFKASDQKFFEDAVLILLGGQKKNS